MPRSIFTFETTHHALWAEEVTRAEGIAHEVIPAPSAARAKCSIALEILAEDEAALSSALDRSSVPFRIYRPPNARGGED